MPQNINTNFDYNEELRKYKAQMMVWVKMLLFKDYLKMLLKIYFKEKWKNIQVEISMKEKKFEMKQKNIEVIEKQ